MLVDQRVGICQPLMDMYLLVIRGNLTRTFMGSCGVNIPEKSSELELPSIPSTKRSLTTKWKITMCHGKLNYFDWAFFLPDCQQQNNNFQQQLPISWRVILYSLFHLEGKRRCQRKDHLSNGCRVPPSQSWLPRPALTVSYGQTEGLTNPKENSIQLTRKQNFGFMLTCQSLTKIHSPSVALQLPKD